MTEKTWLSEALCMNKTRKITFMSDLNPAPLTVFHDLSAKTLAPRIGTGTDTSVGCRSPSANTLEHARMRNLSLDQQVKERLKQWPQRPPGLPNTLRNKEAWLRGRPTNDVGSCHPFLKLPGSERMRTVPDGLWLNFGGTLEDPFVDIFAVEACGSIANLLDKRSRFAPSTHSLLAVCPASFLLVPVMEGDPTPRWQVTGVIRSAPTGPISFPVRDMRVLYGLKPRDYAEFIQYQVPHAHEMFVPMDVLSARDSDKNPELIALLARAAFTANFFVQS